MRLGLTMRLACTFGFISAALLLAIARLNDGGDPPIWLGATLGALAGAAAFVLALHLEKKR